MQAGQPADRSSSRRFQRDGYERARVIARRHDGVVYADGVGTGKTEIGLAFIEEYAPKEDGIFALVVSPGAARSDAGRSASTWPSCSAQVISFNELAPDEQLAPSRAPHRHLANRKDAYRLVVVDEAHALRNEDTTWYRAMERLLGGARKQVVLLTATPINNGLWDLYNLVMLFARHDRAFARCGIASVRHLFLAAGANERDPESLNPDVLFPLADAVASAATAPSSSALPGRDLCRWDAGAVPEAEPATRAATTSTPRIPASSTRSPTRSTH